MSEFGWYRNDPWAGQIRAAESLNRQLERSIQVSVDNAARHQQAKEQEKARLGAIAVPVGTTGRIGGAAATTVNPARQNRQRRSSLPGRLWRWLF